MSQNKKSANQAVNEAGVFFLWYIIRARRVSFKLVLNKWHTPVQI